MFPLRQICNNIPIDKASIKKTANTSQAIQYSSYVSRNRRIYKTIIEGQVVEIKMIRATPNTATITYSSIAKPLFIEMIVINTQDFTDTQTFSVYENPFTITNLQPNDYYTINTYTVYVSGNRYLNVFENAVRTLYEGPPLELIEIRNPEYDSAILYFTRSIGVPTSINLTVLNHANLSERFFFPNISSPFLITGLSPDITYDISLSSFYSITQNSYSAEYKSAFFKTYNENYPEFLRVSNITHVGASITFRYTGFPSSNIIKVTNVRIPSNNVTIIRTNTDTNNEITVTFSTLPIDSSFNVTITSIYNATPTNRTYPTNILNVFRTLNENPIPRISILRTLGDYLSIEYTRAPGNVLSYDISLVGVNGQIVEYTFPTVPIFVEFPYLAVFTNYTLYIRSNYIANSYLYTYPEYIRTLNQGPISDVSYSMIENTSAHVYFNPAPGVNQTYNIVYQGQRNNTTVYYINGLVDPSFNLTGLSIFTPYTFTIYSYYELDRNSYRYTYMNPDTNNALFTTLNQNASTILRIDNVTSNSMNILFINVFGSPNLFTFYAKNSLNQTVSGTFTGASNNTITFILSGLTPSTAYTVSMITTYITSDNVTRTYPTIYSGNPVITLS